MHLLFRRHLTICRKYPYPKRNTTYWSKITTEPKTIGKLTTQLNIRPNGQCTRISFLLAILIIACLLYQLIIIRRRDNLLYKRAAAINGVIHDLKSPLNATHAILLYFAQVEENKDKLELLKAEKHALSD